MAEIYIYPGPKKKPRKRTVVTIVLAVLLLLAAAAFYIAGSWGSGHAPGWLLTERSHRAGERTLTFEALPADQYQDAAARALGAELAGDGREHRKYFQGDPRDLLPPGRNLSVTALATGAPQEDIDGTQAPCLVTVDFGGGERLSLTVGRLGKDYLILEEAAPA